VYTEAEPGFCKAGMKALASSLGDFPNDSNLLQHAVSAYLKACHLKPNSRNI